LANNTKNALGLKDQHMTFFVSHAAIDEKHAADVEKIVALVCKNEADWKAVDTGMVDTLNMAINIFEEIYQVVAVSDPEETYAKFLAQI
jgi:pyrroloquinoline quinone (PQQ) biosynthesis protein C